MINVCNSSLHSSNLNDGGLRVLYYSLINNAHFRSLDIGDCGLSDESVPIVKEIILRKEHEPDYIDSFMKIAERIWAVGGFRQEAYLPVSLSSR